jgi:hypothetical protein
MCEAYHSFIDLQLFPEDEDTTQDEQIEQTEETTEETIEQTEEEPFIEVVYNKEPKKVKMSEAPNYIQKGMNYDKIKGKAEQLETTLEKAAKIQRFDTVDAYLKAIEDAETQAQKQRYEQAGITDPKIIDELIEKNPIVQQAKQLTEQQNFNSEANELAGEFKEAFGRDITPEDVSDEVLAHRKGTGKSLSESFFFVNRKNIKTFIGEAKKQAEKQTIANLHDRARRGVISSDGLGEDVDISDIDTEMARAFGNDPKEIAKYKRSKRG